MILVYKRVSLSDFVHAEELCVEDRVALLAEVHVQEGHHREEEDDGQDD